jgi:hypothetical protein
MGAVQVGLCSDAEPDDHAQHDLDHAQHDLDNDQAIAALDQAVADRQHHALDLDQERADRAAPTADGQEAQERRTSRAGQW